MNKRAPEVKNNQATPPPSAASLLRELWLGTCSRYTVLCLCLLLISAIAAESLTVTYVDTVRFFLLLPFALCITLAAHVRRADKLSAGAKCTLHPLLFLGGFYLCCYLPFQISTKPSGGQILLLLCRVALLYGAGMIILWLATRKRRQSAIDNTPYVSQFGNKGNK